MSVRHPRDRSSPTRAGSSGSRAGARSARRAPADDSPDCGRADREAPTGALLPHGLHRLRGHPRGRCEAAHEATHVPDGFIVVDVESTARRAVHQFEVVEHIVSDANPDNTQEFLGNYGDSFANFIFIIS